MKSAIHLIEMDVLATMKELFTVLKWSIQGQLLFYIVTYMYLHKLGVKKKFKLALLVLAL